MDNYSIWCIRKIFYLHLSIPRAQANTVQHTYLIVVSITEIIEYYKKGYMSATVGTRWHLMSSDDLSSLSNLVSTTYESSESASQTYNPFYNIPPITSAYQTTYKSQFNFPTVFQEIQLQPVPPLIPVL